MTAATSPVSARAPWGAWLFGAAALIILALAVLVRYGPATSLGRGVIERQLNGLNLGAVGRLGIEGLTGDPWNDPAVKRLTLTDKKGVWLDARGVTVRWRPAELLQRRVRVSSLVVGILTLARRPTLSSTGPSSGRAPVSVRIDTAHARIEMTPQFALRRGVYDLSGTLDLERSGQMRGVLEALSRLHAGDQVSANFDIGRDHAFRITADARETQGGALAGSLGLAADRPFFLTVRAAGSLAQGQVFADSRVGVMTPLQVRGSWNKAGGQAHGVIELAASSLLARYSAMAGPEARFDLDGHKAGEGLYAFNLAARAENLQLAASGEANAGAVATGPKGLRLDAQVGETNRLVSFPKMGAGRITGVLTGDRKHWVFAGSAAAEKVADGSYSLARVSGPVRLENHGSDLLIDAQPVGAGGAGRGLLAALLGAQPRGAAQVTRLADGRFLMRQLSLQAVGLRATATGTRGLLGDLKFSGQAMFSNLAMAHAGASGAVAMGWTASQSGRDPWAFSADARGQNFGSGFAEADRLLGRAPRLVLKASYGGGAVTVTSSTLTGAAGEASGAGTLGENGALALKVAWQAKGPFDVGPLEISGQIKGAGSLAGTLASPKADLSADMATVDAPGLALRNARLDLTFQHNSDGTDGKFALTATTDYGPAEAVSGFRFAGDGLDLTGLSVRGGGVTAAGALALRKGEPSEADLSLKVGPGFLLTQGHADGRLKIVGGASGAHADVSLQTGEAILRSSGLEVKSLNFTAHGPLEHLPYKIAANGPSTGGPWRISGEGDLTEKGEERSARFSGSGRLRKTDFHTLSPAEIGIGRQGLTLRALVGAGGGRADINVAILTGAADVKATLTDVDMALLNEDYVGKLSGRLALAGRGDHLGGGFDAHLTGAAGRDMRGAPPVNGDVTAKLDGRVMNVDFHLGNSQGLKAAGGAVLPVETSGAPFRFGFDYHRPLQGRLSVNGEFKPLWDLAIGRGGADSLSGQVDIQMALGGTLSDPRATGQVALDGGHFQDQGTGLKLENVTLRANLVGAAVDVTRFTGVDGAKGQITGSGRASLQRDGASSFRADLTGFRVIDTDLAHVTASGPMSVNRAADGKVKLTGALTIDRAQISPTPPIATGVTPMDVIEIHRPDALDETPSLHANASTPEAPVALDVSIRALGGVYVRGRGLNIELALDSHVGGSLANPELTGSARVVRGDYNFAGQRFQLDERSVIRLGSTAETIRLNLLATREDPSLTAMIKIAGTAARPTVTLTSNPALPQDEILSRVLFGASASQLSGLEAAQLASAVASLSGGGGFDLIGGLRSLAHLDRLAIGDSAVTGTTVHGGKYLTDRIYLELMGGGRTGEGAQIEWRVRKRLSIVGKLGSQGDSQIAIRWRRSY
ncbi:MAG TPA: translocation/assembly module TamB domain-containing protein [Caulobacteraceae bacterium]